MSTRHKKPSVIKRLAITGMLLGVQAYLGFNALGGQFGVRSQTELRTEIALLQTESTTLQAQIDALQHRISLFDPQKLDPDILSERAHALLSMLPQGDIVIQTEGSAN